VKVHRTDLDANQPVGELVLDLLMEKREPQRFEAIRFELAEDGFDLHTELWDVLSLDIRLTHRADVDGIGMRLRLINPTEDMRCRVAVGLRQIGGESHRWMIPGIFYKHNRVDGCRRVYPSFGTEGRDASRMVSKAWSFRSDRSATPAVFLWNSRMGAYVLADERFGVTDQNRQGAGMTGLYFRAERTSAEIGMTAPYSESPVQYAYCHPDRTTPVETWVQVEKNVVLDWEVTLGVGARAIHSYDPVLRAQAQHVATSHPLRPWMESQAAEELVAHGLLQWHADPDKGVVYETAAFDKYFGKLGGYVDRPVMHSGWVNGAPVAYAMLLRGYDQNDEALIHAGRAVVNRISEALTPIGTFWPEWDEETGWTTGLNPKESWVHARTLADTALYMVRALRLQVKKGKTHFAWLQSIQSNLDFAVGIQREDGCLGTCYDVESGTVTEWDGCGGMAWIGALVAGSALLYDPKYREAARKAGAYYARFIEDEFLYGAAEDQYLTPTVEDGYCAVAAYLLLYELDRGEKWLRLARRAADWALTFRFTYNVAFSRQSLLGLYEYRTRGADISSPAAHAICNQALWTYPEMIKLTNLTGDAYYRDRAEEHRISCLQMIAREDGEFGARKGMVPHQLYHTDWWQPKGCLLSLSHASSLGGVLYANVSARLAMAEQLPLAGRRESGKATAVQDTETDPAGVNEIKPTLKPLDQAWAPTDPRDTQEINVKWKIF